MTNPPQKKQKPNRKKTLILNVFTNGTAATSWGLWRHPEDQSRSATTDLKYWTDLAKLCERGKLNGIFIADHYSVPDVYKGPHNFEPAAEIGVSCPRVTPEIAVSAMALVTESIGFGVTFSSLSEHPYLLARRLATLDHFTNGRIGWNVVSSYLSSAARQVLNGESLPEHSKRYEKTQEYIDVIYELLLSSWREDALIYDKINGKLSDSSRIREINFEGKYFNVPGPIISEPSKQRFPVIFQAGTSREGRLFAAENTEILYTNGGESGKLAEVVRDIRAQAVKFNRDPYSVKVIVAINPIIGNTHEEAVAKQKDYEQYLNPEGQFIQFGGVSDIDLAQYDWDDPVDVSGVQNGKTNAESFALKNGKALTKQQIFDKSKIGGIVGSVEEVADQLEKIVDDTDIDGFNFIGSLWPKDYEILVDGLVPELRRRGLFWDDYPVIGGSFRENLYGAGHHLLRKDHPAHGLIWNKDQTKEQFEEQLAETKITRARLRAESQK